MIETLQLEESVAAEHHDAPRLLVEWSPRWNDFVTSIGPALGRSEPRLAGEAPFGLVPFRIMLPSYLLEALLVFAVIAIQVKIAELRPYVVPRSLGHDVIYYSGDELPRTEDLGGAQSGQTGRAGGSESHHRTQTIKIARGGSLVPRVVDAPNLKLPSSRDAVANLLAIRPDPGPPPSEGMRSSRSVPNLQTNLVAPAPNVIHDYTRNGIAMNEVIAPAPSVARDRILTAPNLSANLVPPAPGVSRDRAQVAPSLSPSVVAPAPNVSRDHALVAPYLVPAVVAPAPNLDRDGSRSAPTMSANVIPPAPGAVTRQLSSAPVQMANIAVVPPPVTAPEHASQRDAKLSLPAPSVIAPPPSTDVAQDMRHLASGSIPDPSAAVVPPPQTQAGSGSLFSSIIGKILGPSEVVAPPPSVSSTGSRSGAGTLAPNVVAPPPSVSANAAAGDPRGMRNGPGTSLGSNVIAPPSSAGVTGGTGTRASSAPMLGPGNVVPPPPSLAGHGGGTGTTAGGSGAPGGTLLANNIVPPPPSIGAGSGPSGSGLGRTGAGLGSPMNVGSNLAPPVAGGAGNNAGAVISTQPGSKVGLPTSGGGGALAMSPTGGDKPGLGGSGGGTGIGHGNGPGSGVSGEGTGAGKAGPGRGSDPNARGGISLSPGPGGAGNATSGNPPVPGVSVSGGSTIVNLPSFGTDGDPAPDTSTNNHSPLKKKRGFDVDIVASANSGGAFEPYKNLLHGEKHTIYPVLTDTTIVMEYADESSSARAGALTAPQAIRTDLPAGLAHKRMVVACTLDASGNLKNLRVLDTGSAEMTAKVIAALRTWKFEPALRGDQPVEVTAILGFGIDTNDRF